MKNTLLLTLFLATTIARAQTSVGEKAKEDFLQNTTFGGYVVGKASFNDQELQGSNKSHSDFDLRMIRAYVDGKVLDFKYKLQMELSGKPGDSSTERGCRVVDAWVEWQKYKFFTVRMGQFKRAFTFENPMNPWDIGFGNYSQLTTRLAGMSDRVGEHSSGGRDQGVQVQGDFLPVGRDRHNFIHYQVAIYNGQGINHSDENNSKDLVGGVYLYPLKELAVGVFGWNGDYTRNGITVDRRRLAVGVKYESAWSFRAEYATSKGYKISDYGSDGLLLPNATDKADAWYTLVGVPLTKKCKLYAKWDVYRDRREWNTQKSLYCLSANYYFFKNFKLQANYAYTRDKNTAADSRYHTFDLQLYWRF